MGPGEVGELELEVAGLEVGDEEDETDDVEHEADEAVVGGEWGEHAVDEDDVLEVIDDALAVEEVHGTGQPVPVEALDGLKIASFARDTGDGNNLLKADDLDSGDTGNDVDMPGEKGTEEAADHDEGPEGTD